MGAIAHVSHNNWRQIEALTERLGGPVHKHGV